MLKTKRNNGTSKIGLLNLNNKERAMQIQQKCIGLARTSSEMIGNKEKIENVNVDGEEMIEKKRITEWH